MQNLLVNIISSDRIQELPDANAAETVARIPGYLSVEKVEKEIKLSFEDYLQNIITLHGQWSTNLASTDP